MMGLDDYYSYDYDGKTNYDTPTGGIDMMDFNIGDHDSYSKYILGWKTPTVVTPSYLAANNNQLSLSSFTENGDYLLIPIYDSDGNDDYNETAFDEYLLLELYTPTGLNEMDSNNLYTNNLREYTKPGILVYHVNSRIGKVSVSGSSLVWDGYSYDKLPSSWSSYVGYTYICSNTRSYCYDSSLSDTGLKFYRGRLISLLPSTGTKIEGKKTGYSSNECLFTKGDSFKDSYSSFVFDEGTSPRYDFSVDSVTTSKATLTFSDFN
jgi:hypothetical protein